MVKNQTKKMLVPEKKYLRSSVRSTFIMFILATVMAQDPLVSATKTVVTPWSKSQYDTFRQYSNSDYRKYLEQTLESAKGGMKFKGIKNKRDLDWFESVLESFFRNERNKIARLKLYPESERSRLSTLQTLESETTAAYIQQKIEIVRKIEEEDAIAAVAIQKSRALREGAVRRKG